MEGDKMKNNTTIPKEICKKCKYVGIIGHLYTCDYILRKSQSRAAGAAKLKHKRYLYPECRICRVYEPAKNNKVTLKISSVNKHQSKFEFEDDHDEI